MQARTEHHQRAGGAKRGCRRTTTTQTSTHTHTNEHTHPHKHTQRHRQTSIWSKLLRCNGILLHYGISILVVCCLTHAHMQTHTRSRASTEQTLRRPLRFGRYRQQYSQSHRHAAPTKEYVQRTRPDPSTKSDG